MYVIVETPTGEVLQRVEDGAFIPFDVNNRDYQAYLEWKNEQPDA